MEKFTKEEDRQIIDVYVKSGFYLSEEAIGSISKAIERSESSIRNRMSRYLLPQYKRFLNKDFHIRIFLINSLAKANKSSHPQAYENVLIKASEMFLMNKNRFLKTFNESKNSYWGKDYLNEKIEGCPDTMEQMVTEILTKEDEKYNLFTDLIESVYMDRLEKETSKPFLRKVIERIKNIFK